MRRLSHKHTLAAACTGYVVQAAVNNLSPLLFTTFHRELGVSLVQIGLLVSVNFCVQILMDLLAVLFVDRIGYRVTFQLSLALSCAGFLALGTLPVLLPSPYVGLIAATVLLGAGGGLSEVIVSPIVEALPTDGKASSMAFLHSFYCWGQVGVVLLSTLYFLLADSAYFLYLPFFWAVLPLINMAYVAVVPIYTLRDEHSTAPRPRLFSSGLFWLFCLLMVTAGASELAMSQWASFFAENALQVSKTVGDLAGPCAFAVLMGAGRLFYGLFGERIHLGTALLCSACLCVACYLVAGLSGSPLLSLVACAVTGLSVALMWPGTYSLAARKLPGGGTVLFAILAFFGDIGCSAGPALIGMIAGTEGEGLHRGILLSAVFPAVMVCGSLFLLRRRKRTK